jgi:L-threonylcarbamoyladenylate synthase
MRRGATRVLVVEASDPEPGALQRAAAVLGAGGLVAFPTETFYGLGAAALDAGAVRRVFRAKGRQETKPLLVLVDSPAMVQMVAVEVPAAARRLMAQHWPGPLTLVLRAGPAVPDEVTAGTGTVGVRVSSHPVARGLVRALAGPVTAPSANPSGAEPPTTAAAVLGYFEGVIALVLDGGPTPGGPPSTVLDLTVEPARVIRQGAVHVRA